jgi:hypothetical protein
VSITATNYIRNINTNFPVPGKDNSTNTFRNNWSNITGALSEINSQTNHLALYAVDVTNTSTNLFGNILDNLTLKNSSVGLVDNGILAGDITVDFSQGNYQKITLTAGLHNITIINLPQQGKSAELILSFTVLNPGATSVNFLGTVDLGPSYAPYPLNNKNTLFKLYSEFSALSTSNTVFVQKLNELIFNNTSTNTQVSTNYIIRDPGGNSSNDRFLKISTATGAFGALNLTSQISGNLVSGNLALTNNIVKTNIASGNWSSPTNNTATTFGVVSAINIIPGATFNLPTTGTSLLVTSVTTNTVTCTPPFPTGIGTGEVIFKNPTFNAYGGDTAFPVLAILVDTPANTSTGAIGTFAGSIYASKNHLEITYDDPSNSSNTFVIDTQATTTVTNRSAALADTEFVHRILPAGSVIMWYGTATSIPFGWALCNGQTVNGYATPDLRDKFVVGAGSTYAVGDTGGRTDTVLPSHSHDIVDPGHKHKIYFFSGGSAGGAAAQGNANGSAGNADTEIAHTGITATESIGTSSYATTNLPPYRALCYIMKVSG